MIVQYFETNKKDQKESHKKKCDKSNYFASITTLNGLFNGSPGCHCLLINPKTMKFAHKGEEGSHRIGNTWIAMKKMLIIFQNLANPYLTMQRDQMNV